jgi:hypothetical protein
MQYYIKCCSGGSKKFEQNEKETLFLDEFFAQLPEKEKHHICLERKANGIISVMCNTYPVGNVKLQGKKFSMQILKGLYTVKMIEGDVDDFIQHIPDWCKYITLHCH